MSLPIKTHWLLENRVRLLTLPRHLSTEVFQSYDDATCFMMDSLTFPLFHVIVDVRTMETFPPLSACIKMRSIRHSRMGWMISVGATQNPLMRFFLGAVVGASRIRYKDCDTLEEALDFLVSHDPGLPSLEAWDLTTFPRHDILK